jgi:Effector-associated domain 7/TIR domain
MPSTVKTPAEILTKLRQNLVDSFSDTELRDLCFDLGIDYEDLPGQGKAAKARELVAYCERRGLTTELIKKCSELRPHVSWGAVREPLEVPTKPQRDHVVQPTAEQAPTSPVSQHDVFMSYCRRDTQIMHQVLQDLRAQGLQVWVDEEGLEPGTPAWKAAIEEAIENSRCLVVILSPDAKDSIWVARELSYAEVQKVPIFPVLACGDERGAVPIQLVASQWVDVRQDYSGGMQKLCTAVRRHLGA